MNIVYLVLEFIDGQSIKQYFDRDIPTQLKFALFLQILGAVSYAHSKDVIHRDIKPGNLMVLTEENPPQVKVLDFGISKILTTISRKETLKGYYTPLFASPEQRDMQGIYRESDVYSLGMTFAYLLSSKEDRIACEENFNKAILYESISRNIKIEDNLKQRLIDILKKATIEKKRRQT